MNFSTSFKIAVRWEDAEGDWYCGPALETHADAALAHLSLQAHQARFPGVRFGLFRVESALDDAPQVEVI